MSSAEQATQADLTPPAADPARAIDFLSAWPSERAWVYTFPDGRPRTELYEGNGLRALESDLSAWDADQLVGLGNAISDGHLVVYYPHLLVAPAYQGRGIGRQLVAMLRQRYAGFHQQVLVAEGEAIAFYEKCGFVQAGRTCSMWIYQGGDG